ncbi:MAG: hypothetical protein ACLGSD_08880 [Acidobacteriota bacterium]
MGSLCFLPRRSELALSSAQLAKKLSKSLSARLSVGILGSLLAMSPLYGQATGPDFPVPSRSSQLGVKDAGALAEVVSHIRAAGGANWNDLEASGTIVFGSSPNDSHTATLTLVGAKYSRLDVTFDAGVRSLRLRPVAGRSITETGDRIDLPPATACAGLVAFPRLWRRAVTSQRVSLFDRGMFNASGSMLHRVTMEYAPENEDFKYGPKTVATDLYFDPQSHNLLYSVDFLAYINTHGQRLLRITQYSNYRSTDGVNLPTTISESLGKQLQWTLQLTSIQLNQSPALSLFLF